MNIRYISNIFQRRQFVEFLVRLPCLREDSPLPPRRYCTIFAKVVSRGTYETEKTDL